MGLVSLCPCVFFFFNDTATTEIYTLSLHDALPICWMMNSGRRGDFQSAYQVLVARTPEKLSLGQEDLWDSGKVESRDSIHVPYSGVPLDSRTRCYWKVRVWDNGGKASPWSAASFWTMGLLKPEDWKADRKSTR